MTGDVTVKRESRIQMENRDETKMFDPGLFLFRRRYTKRGCCILQKRIQWSNCELLGSA